MEQKNEIYTKESDSTSLYWLNDKVLHLPNSTKCNIYALNTLFRAGFKCPKENARTADLYDENNFIEELPVVKSDKAEDLLKGDLIVWNGHVIIFEHLVKKREELYAKAIWAGTRQKDNDKNVINNVSYGEYPLRGNFIARRPVRIKKP